MAIEAEILNRLEEAITAKVFPGGVLGLVRKSGERLVVPAGYLTYEGTAPTVNENTIYDLASVTKAIPGSCSLLKLLDEGKINLEDRLADFLPEFGNFENKKEVRIRHILTYTLDLKIADISALSALKHRSADDLRDLVISAPLGAPPGSKHIYTNAAAGFIAPIVEKVTGQRLDAYADDNFFAPLAMNRTTYHPEKFDKNEIAPTEIDSWRGRLIQGEVHDESTYVLQQKYVTAIAGLFSTVPDLLNFLEMLLREGSIGERRYFSPGMVRQMHTNQLADELGDKTGLGWMMNWPAALGTNCSEETFCKSGFTGTMVAIDPVKGVAFTLLTNRIYPKRPKDSLAINAVRKDLADLIFA